VNLFNKAIVAAIPLVPKPMVGYFSQRYIAGSKLQDAVDEVKRLNDEGMCATVDVLGEGIKKIEDSREPVEKYLEVLEAVEKEKLDANISVKPTQLGLMLDYQKCLSNYRELIESAKAKNNFVRIDMEDSPTTDATIKLYTDLKQKYENVGLVLQAYLRRTLNDIENLSQSVDKLNLRICKGIYVEPHEIAWKDRDIVRKNFELLLRAALEKGAYIGIATHDEHLVWAGLRVIHEMNIPQDRYEFQMLLGVLPNLRRIIVNSGHKLRVYVPFGEQWYPYSTRRLRENPQVAGHIFKALLTPAER
jgi:proline dehydrogenase